MGRTSRSLLTTIMQRQLRYLGHVPRDSSPEKDSLLGMIEDKRAREMHRMKLMDGLNEVIGCISI